MTPQFFKQLHLKIHGDRQMVAEGDSSVQSNMKEIARIKFQLIALVIAVVQLLQGREDRL